MTPLSQTPSFASVVHCISRRGAVGRAALLAFATFQIAAFMPAGPAFAHNTGVIQIAAADMQRQIRIDGRHVSPADIIGMEVIGPDDAVLGTIIDVHVDELTGNAVLVRLRDERVAMKEACYEGRSAEVASLNVSAAQTLAITSASTVQKTPSVAATTVAVPAENFKRSKAANNRLVVDADVLTALDAAHGGEGSGDTIFR